MEEPVLNGPVSRQPRLGLAGLVILFLAACAQQTPLPTHPEEPGQAPVSASGSGAVAAAAAPAGGVPAPSAANAPALPTVQMLDASRLPQFDGERQVLEPAEAAPATVDRTVSHNDLWERVRKGFGMADLDNRQVRERTAWYVANQEYLKRVFDRSRLYLYYIVTEVEKRGMPTEIALLPMVESAFNPMAYSRAHASGLWQFIPGTGKRYELTQNWWFDGRRDVVASTDAALDYLEDLYKRYGDWHLALASYNWGENAVGRAIEKNRAAGKPTDYASLKMPPETRGYVPKLQAFKNIVANPAAFGIVLEPIPNQPYFATVTKSRDIDVQLAAKLAEMPLDEFIALNPGFSRPLINVSVSPRLVLPADKVEVFHANLEKLDDQRLVSWQSYRPKQGDTLESIARKFHMPLNTLKEVNGIGPRTKAVPQLIVVPTEGGGSIARMPIMYAPPIPVPTPRRITHTVKQGETLTSIANRYRVRVDDLKQWNKSLTSSVAAGQKLVIQTRAGSRTRTASKTQPKGKPREAQKAKPYRSG